MKNCKNQSNRMSPSQWQQVRQEWEIDDATTFADLSVKYPVSRQAISKMAYKHKWAKKSGLKVAEKSNQRNQNVAQIQQEAINKLLSIIRSPKSSDVAVIAACSALLKCR